VNLCQKALESCPVNAIVNRWCGFLAKKFFSNNVNFQK
jgi:hypothetical protein